MNLQCRRSFALVLNKEIKIVGPCFNGNIFCAFCSRYQEECSDSEKSSHANEAGSGEGFIRNGEWHLCTFLKNNEPWNLEISK